MPHAVLRRRSQSHRHVQVLLIVLRQEDVDVLNPVDDIDHHVVQPFEDLEDEVHQTQLQMLVRLVGVILHHLFFHILKVVVIHVPQCHR